MVNNPTNIKQKDYFVDENTSHGMGKTHKKNRRSKLEP